MGLLALVRRLRSRRSESLRGSGPTGRRHEPTRGVWQVVAVALSHEVLYRRTIDWRTPYPLDGAEPIPRLAEEIMKADQSLFRPVVRILLAAAFILMVPLLAMQVTDEVVWTVADFAVAGVLLVGTGLTYTLVARKGGGIAYRAAVGVGVAAALLLVWLNLAVGIIGTEADPANLMYIGVLAVEIVGALIARFQPLGMARALFATALAQVLVTVIALSLGWGSPESRPAEILGVTAMFVALFVGSALLFRYAAREHPRSGAALAG